MSRPQRGLMLKAAAAYKARVGVQIRLFSTSPGLIVPQLLRDVQNDLIVARLSALEQASAVGLIPSGKRAGPWRNPLVLAGLRGGKADGPVAGAYCFFLEIIYGHRVLWVQADPI